MRRIMFLLAALFMAAALGAGVQGGEKKKLTFGYLTPDLGNQYWVDLADGIAEVCKAENINLLVFDARSDPAKELANAEDLIQKKVDYIMISPWDSDSGATVVDVIHKAGIPVSVLDVGVSRNAEMLDTFVITDNFAAGVTAGKYIADVALGGDTSKKVAHIQCKLGRKNTTLRGDGFTSVMDERGIKVVARQPADCQRSLGMTVMQNMLQAHPDLAAVFCENDEMALGALEAVSAAGLDKQVKVVGFDAIADAIQSIKKGGMAATIIQPAHDFGILGAKAAIKSLNGEKLPPETFVPTYLLTKEDILSKKYPRYN